MESSESGRFDLLSVFGVFVALVLIGCLFWMHSTRNMFCCDKKSLVGQLLSEQSSGR